MLVTKDTIESTEDSDACECVCRAVEHTIGLQTINAAYGCFGMVKYLFSFIHNA